MDGCIERLCDPRDNRWSIIILRDVGPKLSRGALILFNNVVHRRPCFAPVNSLSLHLVKMRSRQMPFGPSVYSPLPFHIIRTIFFFSSAVVGAILSVFIYHLHKDGYKLPFTFLVVSNHELADSRHPSKQPFH